MIKKGGVMKKMNTAEGALLLLGFILILTAVIGKLAGIDLLNPIIKSPLVLLTVGNTCLLLTLVINRFSEQ